MPIRVTLLLIDNGERCESQFKGEVLGHMTSRENKLAMAIKAVVDPLLKAEGCNRTNALDVDRKPID